MSHKAPFRQAVDEIAAPWAAQHGFTRSSAHVFTRPASIPQVLEVIELQKSVKHPYRTFTVNLGFFHPEFSAKPPPAPNDLACVDCARHIRIGHVMPKRFWRRWFIWLRFGSGWHWWELLPGDFWWSYRDGDDSLAAAMHHALSQVERYALPWFHQFSSFDSAVELFDPAHFGFYETPGFFPEQGGAPPHRPQGTP